MRKFLDWWYSLKTRTHAIIFGILALLFIGIYFSIIILEAVKWLVPGIIWGVFGAGCLYSCIFHAMGCQLTSKQLIVFFIISLLVSGPIGVVFFIFLVKGFHLKPKVLIGFFLIPFLALGIMGIMGISNCNKNKDGCSICGRPVFAGSLCEKHFNDFADED